MNRMLRQLLIVSIALCAFFNVHAQAQGQQKHGDYTVYHTVFNSTFLQPDIARAYGLVRGDQWFLVNISVNGGGRIFGQKALLKGTASDLMQRQTRLEFQEINEGDATYYIAPLRIPGQEILHFSIEVQPAQDAKPFVVKFSHKFARE